MSKRAIRNTMISIVVIAVIGIALALLLPKSANKSGAPLPKPIKIDTSNQPTLGNLNAKLHIVAFEDLKCVNCMRYSTQVFPKIKHGYIDSGKAKYTFINLAFIPGSMPAANAARCIYTQNKPAFFNFVDYIFHNQPPETDNWATIPTLMSYALHIKGIDQDKLAQCLVKSPYTGFIQENLAMASKLMPQGAETPSIYINGVKVSPVTWAQFQYVAKHVS